MSVESIPQPPVASVQLPYCVMCNERRCTDHLVLCPGCRAECDQKRNAQDAIAARRERIYFEFGTGVAAFRTDSKGGFVVQDDIAGGYLAKRPGVALVVQRKSQGNTCIVHEPRFVADLAAEFGMADALRKLLEQEAPGVAETYIPQWAEGTAAARAAELNSAWERAVEPECAVEGLRVAA